MVKMPDRLKKYIIVHSKNVVVNQLPDYYLFGLQRSGTNFLEKIILENYKKKKQPNTYSISWKHSVHDPKDWDKRIPTIIIYKNPYTWMESIAFRNKRDWVGTQKKYPADEATTPDLQVGDAKLNATNLILTYRDFIINWVGRMDIPQYYCIKYEDLLDDQTRGLIFTMIGKIFKWKKNGETYTFPKCGKVDLSPCFSKKSEEYYKIQKPVKLSKHHIHEINRVLGIDMINKLGYNVIYD